MDGDVIRDFVVQEKVLFGFTHVAKDYAVVENEFIRNAERPGENLRVNLGDQSTHSHFGVFAPQYYESVNDYPSQSDVDSAVTTICAMLQLPRLRLHVLATSRGLVAGNIILKSVDEGSECVINCRNSKGGEVVPQNLCRDMLEIQSDAR